MSMFHNVLMEKIAKSRIVREAEKLLAAGKEAEALDLLARAEKAEGTGAYAAKNIKGISDRYLGGGQMGSVSEAFMGGQLVPLKRAQVSSDAGKNFKDRQAQDVLDRFIQEGRDSVEIEKIVREDPELSKLVDTPKYLAQSRYGYTPKPGQETGIVGRSAKSYMREAHELLEKEKRVGAGKLTKKERGRLRFLRRMHDREVAKGMDSTLGRGVGIPMNRVDYSIKPVHLRRANLDNQRDRAFKAREIMANRHNRLLTDLLPEHDHNIVYGASGKPTIADFGIVIKPDNMEDFNLRSSDYGVLKGMYERENKIHARETDTRKLVRTAPAPRPKRPAPAPKVAPAVVGSRVGAAPAANVPPLTSAGNVPPPRRAPAPRPSARRTSFDLDTLPTTSTGTRTTSRRPRGRDIEVDNRNLGRSLALGAGGLAAAYGAKKLYDRYKARKKKQENRRSRA